MTGPGASAANGTPPSRRRGLWRAVVVAVPLVIVLALGALALDRGLGSGPSDPTPGTQPEAGSSSASSTATASGTGPSGASPQSSTRPAAPSPPERVCGSPALRGPSSPPAGAVTVEPGQGLMLVTEDHPPGTTFWLAPGTHHVGPGEYDQVRPKSGNHYIGAPGAVIDGQRSNLYAFGGHASGVRIDHLTVTGFGKPGDNNGEGVVNHDGAPGWTLSHVTLRDNAGAGVLIADGGVVESSCLADNGQYGFNVYAEDGVRDVTLDHNEISGNNTDDWEKRQPGCGCSGGGKFWDTRGATVTNNYVHDNRGVGLWADTDNAGFLVRDNYLADNEDEGLWYEISYNAAIIHNVFVRNGLVKGPSNAGFPTGAVYLSESGSDPRVDTAYANELEVAHNVFVDNWGGVVLWENADRFAGSPANTSRGYGTLVNPEATEQRCGTAGVIKRRPFRGDCRWKTQNVKVHDNLFAFTPRNVGAKCTTANTCGYSGVFSNYGTYPDWSPYQGDVVQRNITFRQDNVWSDNRYVGPWQFMVLEMGHTVSWDEWRAAPYDQDSGSTIDSAPGSAPSTGSTGTGSTGTGSTSTGRASGGVGESG